MQCRDFARLFPRLTWVPPAMRASARTIFLNFISQVQVSINTQGCRHVTATFPIRFVIFFELVFNLYLGFLFYCTTVVLVCRTLEEPLFFFSAPKEGGEEWANYANNKAVPPPCILALYEQCPPSIRCSSRGVDSSREEGSLYGNGVDGY